MKIKKAKKLEIAVWEPTILGQTYVMNANILVTNLYVVVGLCA